MAAPIAVTLYGRPGCSLCTQAEAMLARISKRIPLTVRTVNIDDDDELLRRFLFEVPVIEAAGEIIASAPVSEGKLEDALERIAKAARQAL
jgi:glutaredoxin